MTDNADHRLRVVVVDDHPLYRDGIVRTLNAAGMTVVAEGGDGDKALILIREHQPDVAVLDMSMPGLDGIDVVDALARGGPEVPVVMLSAFDDEPLIRAARQAGAAAYVSKTADRATIVEAVAAAAHPAYAPSALVGSDEIMTTMCPGKVAALTLQEHSLLNMARDNVDKHVMAQRLGIDEPAVRRSLSRAIAKLGADTLPHAVQIAVKTGLLGAAD